MYSLIFLIPVSFTIYLNEGIPLRKGTQTESERKPVETQWHNRPVSCSIFLGNELWGNSISRLMTYGFYSCPSWSFYWFNEWCAWQATRKSYQSSRLNNDATYGMLREYMTFSNLYIVCHMNIWLCQMSTYGACLRWQETSSLCQVAGAHRKLSSTIYYFPAFCPCALDFNGCRSSRTRKGEF